MATALQATDALIRKLRVENVLSDDDVDAVRGLPLELVAFDARARIVKFGERPSRCGLLAEGFAVRSKSVPDGERQILSIHLPGDIPDLQSLELHVLDHDIEALTPCVIAFIAHSAVQALITARPSLRSAFWRETLIDAALFREGMVNLGRRSAAQRLAHLLSELSRRMDAIGLKTNQSYPLPMTQIDLADAIGLTPVHVNRVLQALRKTGAVEVGRGELRLTDAEQLFKLGEFDPLYLHQSPSS